MRTALGTWLRDVVLSCRRLRQRPAFVFVAVASLALGIGANALVFSVVDSVLLQPLSYQDADRRSTATSGLRRAQIPTRSSSRD